MNHKKLQKKLKELEASRDALLQRRKDAEKKTEDLRTQFMALDEKLKNVFDSGENEAELLKQRQKLIDENFMNQKLIEGLSEKLPELDTKIKEARRSLDDQFSELAEQWLQKEIGFFDEGAEMVRRRIKRLGACCALLQTIERVSVWTETIGPAHTYIVQTKIGSIRNFDQRNFTDHSFHFGKETTDAVMSEIINKK